MGKIESLQKLNELKEKGTITEAEFQLEKAKILNDDIDINDEVFEKKEKSKKKPSKIIWIVLLIIIVIPVGIIAIPNIMIIKDMNQMEKKLSQIDAEELQNKIIEELKETPLNAYYSGDSLLVVTEFLDTLEETDNFVTATTFCTTENDFSDAQATAIPCFKIKSDSEGKFQTIEYISASSCMSGSVVQEAIENVFKESYNIDMHLLGENRGKYCSKFLGSEHEPKVNGKSMEIMYDNYMYAMILMTDLIKASYPDITDEDYAYDLADEDLEKGGKTDIWGRLDS